MFSYFNIKYNDSNDSNDSCFHINGKINAKISSLKAPQINDEKQVKIAYLAVMYFFFNDC